MKTALDTNVVSALLGGEHNVYAIGNSLQACKRDGRLIVSPVVYAELFAYPRMTEQNLVRFLNKTVWKSSTCLIEKAGLRPDAGTRATHIAGELQRNLVPDASSPTSSSAYTQSRTPTG